MLVNWEEWIREDNVYSLLYSDSREDATDLLTAQEVLITIGVLFICDLGLI